MGGMETRSKRLAKNAKLLGGAGLGLLLASVMLFATSVKHIAGESGVLLLFSALLAAFSLFYFVEYLRLQCLAVREALREYIDARLSNR